MKTLLREHAMEHVFFLKAALLVLFLGLAGNALKYVYRMETFYSLYGVEVGDGIDVNRLPVVFDREIWQPFSGHHLVTIWPISMLKPACSGSDPHEYKPTSTARIFVDLAWITGSQSVPLCKDAMVPGEYSMEVCIFADLRIWWMGWLPSPKVCVWSNVFEVLKG